MKKFALLFSVLATILLIVNPAVAQYGLWPPGVQYGLWPPGVWGYRAPLGYMSPSYRWREQRFYEDWRRGYLYGDWRRGYIADDMQLRENYETPTILNNPTGRGVVTDPGECAIGFSEETCRRRGQKYNPPKPN
jgi:hypothetical protein